jgi:hypothetical protein
MANILFGTDYYEGWYGQSIMPNTGDWADINQWYSEEGRIENGGETYIPPTKLGRLPLETDTITFKQPVLSNFPASWSGNLINPRLGKYTYYPTQVRVNATGTWSGTITGTLQVWGTATQPVISGVIQSCYSTNFDGGIFSGTFGTNNSGGLNFNNSSYNGPTTITVTFSDISINNTTINASINNTANLTLGGGAIVNGTVSVRSLLIYGNSKILNSPTVTVAGMIRILPTSGDGSWPLVNTTLLTSSSNTVSLGIFNKPNDTKLNIPANVMIRCTNLLSIDNCNMLGSFEFTGTDVKRRLHIRHNSIIAQDISSAAINCYDYTIFSGTFTHPNDWVFGSPTTGANIRMGCEDDYIYNTITQRYENIVSIVNTSKNITIYENASVYTYINTPWYMYVSNQEGDFFNYNENPRVSPLDYGKFTGKITILPTTGYTSTSRRLTVDGGIYAPTATISAIKNGSTYTFNLSEFPDNMKFGNDNNSRFIPNIYINNLPTDNDILATQGIR